MKKKEHLKKIMCMVFMLLLCCLVQSFAAECGDVNGDGTVDIVDALLIAQDYVNLNPANYDSTIADVNGDGEVDIVDALLVAQYYVNLINELTGCGPTPDPNPTSGELVTYELQAEDATWDDAAVESDHAGYTGRGYVNSANSSGRWIEWSINIESATNASCVFTYACASGDRPMTLTVNGNEITTLIFPASGAWTNWIGTEETIFGLVAGSNTIHLTATASVGAANIDKMDITMGEAIVTPAPPTPTPAPVPTDVPTSTPIGWTPPPITDVKHWHESGGFGTNTEGGLGGSVYKVTNLNSSGSGSLKDAVSSGNRLIVFEVGGVINMNGGGISIGGSNITIAGQTAPSPGITLVRSTFNVGGNNIVVSHISVQLGDEVGGYPDASQIKGDNIVFDHVSVYWGKDETLSIHGVNNVTLYKCIIAEGLQYSGHKDVEHSKGSLINNDPRNLSLIGTLYAHNALRNPRCDGGEIFIANDIVYNWAPGWDHKGPLPDPNNPVVGPDWFNVVVSARGGCNVTMVGSVALKGPESVGEYFLSGHNGTANGYVDDNIIKDQQGNDLFVVHESDINVLNSPPLWPAGMEPMPAHEALYEGLRTVGPRPGDRDRHHTRLVRTVADGNGAVIDSQNEVGGYSNEAPHSLPVTVPSGVQARQDWLDGLEDAIAVDRVIDLSRLYNLVGSTDSDKYRP